MLWSAGMLLADVGCTTVWVGAHCSVEPVPSFPDAPIFFSMYRTQCFTVQHSLFLQWRHKKTKTKAVALAVLLLLFLEPFFLIKFTGHRHPKGHPILHRLCDHECIFELVFMFCYNCLNCLVGGLELAVSFFFP